MSKKRYLSIWEEEKRRRRQNIIDVIIELFKNFFITIRPKSLFEILNHRKKNRSIFDNPF